MSNDSIDASDISESFSSGDIETNTNYSRWMTDMAADIAHMKLHQLAIPGAHNSGVDKDGRFHVGMKWAACQYKSFAQQLAAGARYLDLRLVDASYKKDTGGSNMPNYKFIEIFEFAHGGVAVGRQLHHLVEAVNNFASSNPGEIIFIDFHHYDRGRNYAHNSLERCLPKFSPIKNRLIPPSASNLSIGEIREKHPGCNIVLCLNHAYPKPVPANPGEKPPPDKWPGGTVVREQIWNPLRHEWKEDASEDNIKSLVIDLMKSPPQRDYWVLSATVTEQTFPKDLVATNPVRTEAFKPGFQNIKILMVDFIDGINARTSVVDRCITLNRLRAKDKTKPSTPTNFVVTAKDEDTTDGKFQNTLVFNWTPSNDNLGVRQYDIYRDGRRLASTSKSPYEHKNFALKNYTFKIHAIDHMNNQSDPSENFTLIQDEIPPTIPEILKLRPNPNGTSMHLVWGHSTDAAGIHGYEVQLDGVSLQYIPYTPTYTVFTDIYDLTHTKQYEIKIRAKDINDLYSEFAIGILHPRPRAINPRYSIVGYDESTEKYSVNIAWDIDSHSTSEIYYFGETTFRSEDEHGYYAFYHPTSGEGPTFNFQASQSQHITHRCKTWHGLNSVSDYIHYDFVIDATPPNPITNLQAIPQSPKSTILTWTNSLSSNIESYAISFNEAAPILVSASESRYQLDHPCESPATFEVWAINDKGVPSTVESTTIEIAPGTPGIPQVSQITHVSAELNWAASSGLEVRYKISLNGFLVALTNEPRWTLTHLRSHFDFRVEVCADNCGGVSEPAITTFKTLLAPPANLRFSHLNGRCRLAWDPVLSKFPSHEVTINGKVFTTGPGRWGYSFRLSDLSPGPAPHRFTFKVRALLDGASSKESLLDQTLADDVPPAQPGAPIASDISDTSVTLTWEPSSDNVGVTGYQVVLNGLLLFNTPNPRYTFTTLIPGAYHYVFVRALDKDGNLSPPSNSTVFKTTGQPPAPPPSKPNVSITAETANSLKLEWGSLDGGTGVRILLNDEHWRDVLLLPGVMMLNLLPSVEYNISVSVFDVYGQLSEPTVLTHELKDTQSPTTPENLSATASSSDSVTLNWDASTDDIGVCEYAIYNDQVYFDSTPELEYNVTGLMLGSYRFEVRALDYSGNASSPAAINVKVKDPQPGAPSNFRFTRGIIPTLEWDAPDEPITDYRIILTGPQETELPYVSIQPTLKPVLLPLTRYQVRITARNASGESLPLLAELTT